MTYTQGTFKLSDGTIKDVVCYHNSFTEANKAAKRMKKSGYYIQIWIGDEGGRKEL